MSQCRECGMIVEDSAYHPYAACLMFKGYPDGAVVEENLNAVLGYGSHSKFQELTAKVSELTKKLAEQQAVNYGRKVIGWIGHNHQFISLPEHARKHDTAVFTIDLESPQEELDKLLSGARSSAQEWQPIETAPMDGTRIVLGNEYGCWIGEFHPVYQSGFKPDNPWQSMMLNHNHIKNGDLFPTHWMPLPAAPNHKEQSK